MTSTEDLLVRFDEQAPYDIRCPSHSMLFARNRVADGTICEPNIHDWIKLGGRYWRECSRCGLADVTVADLGQPIKTPNVDVER